MNEIEKAITAIRNNIKHCEQSLRSINTVNSINQNWNGKSELGQPISQEKILTFQNAILNYQLAIQALQEKAERENPQPLTLEELKQRKGKPVFRRDCKYWFIMGNRIIVEGDYEYKKYNQFTHNPKPIIFTFSDKWLYFEDGTLFDHEPKDGK